MSKYSKIKSNYIKKTLRKNIDGTASIFERDWYTTGSKLNYGPGKEPLFYDGHFIFTRNNVNFQPRKTIVGTDAKLYKYDDVASASDKSNEVKPDRPSDDIRDFAYYGSCTELVRASVENILRWFPGNITSTSQTLEIEPFDGTAFLTMRDAKPAGGGQMIYLIHNPFGIDLFHTDLYEEDVENPMRYLCLSFPEGECQYEAVINTSGTSTTYEIVGFTVSVNENVSDCAPEREWDNVPANGETDVRMKIITSLELKGKTEKIELFGFQVEGEYLFFSKYEAGQLMIQPRRVVIERYFDALDGFERQLLNRNSFPLYSNYFLTPIEQNLVTRYVRRSYTWPSDGYCICFDDPNGKYAGFVTELYSLAEKMDSLWCDNIWRNMTHEAIKNFDWTYTRDYIDSEAEDNIDGGNAMMKVLRVIGAVFDDAKLSIDGIKNANRVTYNTFNNTPDAMLTDKLEDSGWDIKSTQLNSDATGAYLTNGCRWYPTLSSDNLDPYNVDIDMMRKLILSSKRILSTKGTRHAIEMVMGLFGLGYDEDYTLSEYYYTTKPLPSEPTDSGQPSKELAVDLNSGKWNVDSYDDEDLFYGIPMKEVRFKKQENDVVTFVDCLVPYYMQQKRYDGDLYFQEKGGWGKKLSKDNTEPFKTDPYSYSESVSYLRVLDKADSLLSVNVYSCNLYDIFYVCDIHSLVELMPSGNTDTPTHFVMLVGGNPQKYSSWHMLTQEEIDDENGFTPEGSADAIPVKAATEYLNSIVTCTHGNNPHVGYGNYDDGQSFLEYMEQPFKYSIDNSNVDTAEAEKFKFELTEHEVTANNGKIRYNPEGNDNDLIDGEYVINSKVLVIANKHDNELYKNYFKRVIMHYLMQVIPSTTILILKGC